MKNRSLTLLMTASLGLASVPGALAQSAPASAQPSTSSTQTADARHGLNALGAERAGAARVNFFRELG